MATISRAEQLGHTQFGQKCLRTLAVCLIVLLTHSFERCFAGQMSRGSVDEGRQNKWRFEVAPGNVAQLVFPTGQSDLVRIAISKAGTKIPWNIQLNMDRVPVKFRQRYVLTFRAKADRLRNIAAAVSMQHEPWFLGLYKTIGLTQEWQTFELEFNATETDDNARIHFDVGGNVNSVDLSGVALRALPL